LIVKPLQRDDGLWVVIDENDVPVAGPFATEDAAWDWIEENAPKPPRPRI
jgi:hypothetical protein